MNSYRHGSPVERRRSWSNRRGFTLTEMLVVIAITAVLMAIMFVPLSRALDMSARANATVKAQDAVRTAMRRIVKDLSIATEVYEPRDISLWGYNAWTFARNRARPASGAAPEKYVVRGGVIAMRLPRMQYYDTRNNHFVTPADIDPAGTSGLNYDAVALDSCPRSGHGGAPVELRPVAQGEPDNRITAYFIGLKDPGLRVGGAPVYENLLLFRSTFIPQNNTLNTYCLYRVEFNPQDPRFANWTVAGQPNPDFFYDTTPVTVNGSTKPQYQWWKDATVIVMDAETSDAVRWLETSGKYMPHPLCNWGPSPIDDEVAKPNREIGKYLIGGVGSADLPPLESQTDHGNWSGYPSDGKAAIPPSIGLSPNAVAGVLLGPRIEILNGSTLVFDSQSATRNRLVGYDSLTGRITFGFPRIDTGAAAGSPLQQYYPGTVNASTYEVDLTQDAAASPPAVPTRWGEVKSTATLAGTALIVPGSDGIQKAVLSGSNYQFVEPMRRVGWTGLPVVGLRDPNNPTAPQAKDEYSIDYSTGLITLSPNEDWTQYVPLVRYRFQTNDKNDVVRVSYATKELANVNLGIVEYTRRRQESLPFEVAERVVIRNLKR
jgi:prepilin-type N-terminal cleavage/methylation domain-containing protein